MTPYFRGGTFGGGWLTSHKGATKWGGQWFAATSIATGWNAEETDRLMKKIPQLALQIHPRKLACLLKIVVGRRPVSFEMDPFLGDMLAFRVYFWVGVYLCTRRWIMFDWFPFRAKRKIQKALVDEVYGSMPARFAFWHVSSNKAIHLSFFIFSSLYVSTLLSISHIINVSPSSVMFVFMPYPLVVFADDVFTAPWNWHVFTTHVECYASVHTLHMPKHVM